MQTTQQHSKHRVISRSRGLAAVVLMLMVIPLITSCGGGDQGNGGGGNGGQEGGGGNGGGQEGGGNAQDGGGGGSGGGTTGGGTSAKDAPPITDLRSVISVPNKKVLNGNRANLRGMEVRGVVSERAFLVGENDAERLLVLNVGDAVEVAEGQQFAVAGRLNVPRPDLEEKLSLSPEEVSAMEDQGIFLRAPRVVPEEG